MKHQHNWPFIHHDRPWPAFLTRAGMFLVLLATVCPLLAADPASAASAASDYARWIKPWVERPATSSALGGAELKLIVTTVRGEVAMSLATNMTVLERLNLSYHITASASEITTNGACHRYFASNTGATAGSVKQFSADDWQKLDQSLAQLPADDASLPPPGQRVVVQVLVDGQWRIRVYDGAKAPPEVKAILDLIGNPFDKGY